MKNKEQIYRMIKAAEYLPGSIRWRVGSFVEHPDQIDRIRFVTPDQHAYVIEYRTFVENNKTLTDVYDIIEINPKEMIISG